MNERQLQDKIDKCRQIMKQTKAVFAKPTETPGSFVTGRSNHSKSLNHRLKAESKQKAKAFRRYQKAKADLTSYQQRLMEKYGEYLRATVQPGDEMAPADNINNRVIVKRINKGSVITKSGTKWAFDELLLIRDGQVMTWPEIQQAIREFEEVAS